MRLNDSDAERVFSGQVPAGHDELAPVAAFLSDLPHSCPPAEVGPARDEHLYAITREARIVAAAPPPRARRNTRRLVVTAVAAGVGVLSMGVGVAAAVGANPLSFLPNLLPQPAISARVDTPASVGDGPGRPVGSKPTAIPSNGGGQGEPGNDGTPGSVTSNNGKSDEAKSEHKPTSKPSHTNNGKSGKDHGKPTAQPSKGRPDNPGAGKPEAKPNPSGKASGKPSSDK